ncbi:hypothetical protein E4U41_005387, partial [Claviceps citrina]
MPAQLLPASAAAFAPRASSVNVVLGTRVEPWLTQTLKRVSRVKRPLNSVAQHQRCLAETLSSATAIWTLASLMLPRLPDAAAGLDMDMDTDMDMHVPAGPPPPPPPPPLEALFGHHRLLHVEAYIVHVDMILRNEVAFKLTRETIDALVEHHDRVHCADARAGENDGRCESLRADFVQAVNRFVYRTHVSALEGLEDEGAGELLAGRSEEVRNSLMGLMKPLRPPTPPPPRLVHP